MASTNRVGGEFVRDTLSRVQRALEPLPVCGKGRFAERILRRTKEEMPSCHPRSGDAPADLVQYP